MQQLSVWVGAGLITAGMSAALAAGAGVSNADTGSGGESGGSSSSSTSDSSSSASSSQPSSSTGAEAAKDRGVAKDRGAVKDKKDTPESDKKDKREKDKREADEKTDAKKAAESTTDTSDTKDTGDTKDTKDTKDTGNTEDTGDPKHTGAPKHTGDAKDAASDSPEVTPATTSKHDNGQPDTPTRTQGLVTPTVAKDVAAVTVSTSPTPTALQAVAPTPAPAPVSLLGVIQAVVSAVVVNVGSFAFNAVQAVEALVTGPPVLPPGSTVTVRSSTVLLSNGQRVAANWYYPKTDDGAPPADMILLQHGFFALGPMYSYTAANLAEKTGSVVVTTTLSSNPFAGDDFWLGGTGMASSIADLFVGDRAALTASADDAGYAAQYGLDPVTATLPRKFALVGHSLGANLVSGAAGFLVDKGAADDLVGVILLDGVPVGSTLPDALTKLDAYAASDGGHYVPVRQIGAPLNLYNFTSTVNADLTAARPDRFNGVVLAGGVHSDSMSGGNPLIQFALYLAAGFPLPQNPPAVDELSVQWLNQWFAGDTSAGDGLVPGSTIDVPTPNGTAHGTVIGTPPATVAIAPSTPTAIPSTAPQLATIAA